MDALRGERTTAWTNLSSALRLALELEVTPLTLGALVVAAPLLVARAAWRTAGEILALAMVHPAATKETREMVSRLRAELGDGIGGCLPKPRPLKALVAEVLAGGPPTPAAG